MIHGHRAFPAAQDFRQREPTEQQGPTPSLPEIGRLMYTNELRVEDRLAALRRAHHELSRHVTPSLGDADPAALLIEINEAIARLKYSVLNNFPGTPLDYVPEPEGDDALSPYEELLADLETDDRFELAAWDKDDDDQDDDDDLNAPEADHDDDQSGNAGNDQGMN